eukprot:1111329-Prymnesium_polylepis.1
MERNDSCSRLKPRPVRTRGAPADCRVCTLSMKPRSMRVSPSSTSKRSSLIEVIGSAQIGGARPRNDETGRERIERTCA